ncbi:MAG: RluA family pseudouridine synthase [Candidatus Binatia bacterium]
MTKPPACRYLLLVSHKIIVAAGETSKKLENFLKKRYPIGYVRKLFRKSGVRLNGTHAGPDNRVEAGDEIRLFIPFENRPRAIARQQPKDGLRIIFENDELLIIDKPAGIAVHEGKGILKRQTVIGLLESKYRPQGIAPRLVHRLDRDTSGLLVLAKNEETTRALEESFDSARVEKEYVCLVAGRLHDNEGRINMPLPGRQGSEVRASTRFRVVKKFPDVTLLRVWIETGRMHQIRLHFAEFGYPIVMDDQHGDFTFNKIFRKEYGLKRQFLHATRITLHHKGKKRTWAAPLSGDLQHTLQALDLRLTKRT